MVEASFITFAQRTPSLVFTMAPDGRVEFVNARWSEVIAADATSMLGYGWRRYLDARERRALLASLEAHADGARPYVAEWRFKRAGEADRWVEIRAEAHVDEAGRVVRWYGAGVDIDAKRRANAANEREERFHRIADAIPQLMWIADVEGTLEWVNARWLDYTGQSAHDTLARGWRTIVHPDDVERTNATWRAAGDVAATYECEFRLRARDGTYRWFLARATPVSTASGLKWYGTNTDIDDARRAARTLRVFADLGKALSESLGLQETLEAVMQSAVPEYADWAFVTLADESRDLYIAAIYHADEAIGARLRALVGKLYARGGQDGGSPAAVQRGEPLLYARARYEDAARVVERDVLEVLWDAIGFTSVLVVPLVVGLAVRGTFTICMAQSHRSIDSSDLPFFTELGRRIAPAIANAEIFERERRVAKSFQEAALPASLPVVDGYVFSAIYEAGRMEALVGGDWYDAFKLLDGRIVVSIGDVAGSGLRAAVTMSNIRQAIRGVAHVHADPELMLEAADRALRTENPDSFATAFVGVIDPVSATMSYRSAGHPAALVSSRANGIVELRTGGLPLGLRDPVRAPADLAELPVGSVLYLYTDGLTESTHDMLAGERRLVAAIAATEATSPAARAEALYDSILVDGSRDDVAILTVSVMGRAQPQRWTLDARVPAIADRVRAEVVAALRIGRDAPDATLAVEIILAEIVGNLVRYAPDDAEIVLDWDEDRPVMHVLDRGPGFEFLPKLPPDLFSESGRGLFLISTLAADFNVTRRIDGGSHARVVFAI